jgi:hypothetical protein
MRTHFFIQYFFYLLFSFVFIINKQPQTGFITGLVQDEDGNPVYGASVKIKEQVFGQLPAPMAVIDYNYLRVNLHLPLHHQTI